MRNTVIFVLKHPTGDNHVPGTIGTSVVAKVLCLQTSLKLHPVAENIIEEKATSKAAWVVGQKKVHIPACSMVVLTTWSSAYFARDNCYILIQ